MTSLRMPELNFLETLAAKTQLHENKLNFLNQQPKVCFNKAIDASVACSQMTRETHSSLD